MLITFVFFIFFNQYQHSTALVDQIRTIKKTSEARLEMMKKEVITVEGELEEVSVCGYVVIRGFYDWVSIAEVVCHPHIANVWNPYAVECELAFPTCYSFALIFCFSLSISHRFATRHRLRESPPTKSTRNNSARNSKSSGR